MSTAELILAIVLFVVSALLVFAGVRQLQCKGYCFNNAYIYASKTEREQTDYTPYYKQSGIVLLMLSALFLLNGLRIVLRIGFLFYVSLVLIAAVILYSIVSSIIIENNK